MTILEVCNVTKRFGGLTAIDRASFKLDEGEILGLLGPNGSGKTTLINIMSGVLRADDGAVVFAGTDITRLPSHKIARARLARTFQLVRVLPALTCRENVLAGLAFHKNGGSGHSTPEAASALLRRVGLGGFDDRLAADLTYIDQKRLELARALALRPRVLLLDEWLAGLNPSELVTGIELLRSISAEGVTLLMVEHVMDAIRALCGRCVVLASGKLIAEGATADVLEHSDVVSAYLGAD